MLARFYGKILGISNNFQVLFSFPANEWCPNHDDTNEKSSIGEKSCRSEKISYKHKIKKHGKTIMKYKFFRRLRPHHEDFYGKSKSFKESRICIWAQTASSKILTLKSY